ncbi:MAG: L-serine ammonia-lyase [Psychromonas sp.]|nr:L-serine ammonia-lyase [Psychromonas sp.]
MYSIFEIYKIGLGPSSSHTNGPMIASYSFNQIMEPHLDNINRIVVDLYGSLSLTGKGHQTNKAILLGLLGYKPESIEMEKTQKEFQAVLSSKKLTLKNKKTIYFDYDVDIKFHQDYLTLHENGMSITAFDNNNEALCSETYYSVGGGFIKTAGEFESGVSTSAPVKLPFPFTSAETWLDIAEKQGMCLGSVVLQNELQYRTEQEIYSKSSQIWKVMSSCLKRGLETEGVLEGGLNLLRRAPPLLKKLNANKSLENDPMQILDWINLYAFAISEENAAGGQVVTSPTNGAAGVIPAVLTYYDRFIHPIATKQLIDFLAVSAAIGMLYKNNASISGAEVGCQGEIGVSSSMASGGLTAILGGTNEQVCIAAEIAMEHSLGMTCDPMAGLVQVPCIERNAMGAIKAINASRMALKCSNKALISLDKVIETMYKTGKDMNKKYRETSLGGLALIHIAPCE